MSIGRHRVALSVLCVALASSLPGSAQTSPARSAIPQARVTAYNVPLQHAAAALSALVPKANWELDPLVNFKSSDIKFNLQTLMDTLRDNRHEGWVLAAYPDPKTSRPLIGAGFSLDLPAREHTATGPAQSESFPGALVGAIVGGRRTSAAAAANHAARLQPGTRRLE